MMTKPILLFKSNERKGKDYLTSAGRIEIFHDILRGLGIYVRQREFGMGSSIFDYYQNINPFTNLVLQALKDSTQETDRTLQFIRSGNRYLWMINRFTRYFISILKELKAKQNPMLTSETLKVSLDLFSALYLNTLDARSRFRWDIAVSTCQFVSVLAQLPEMITHEMMCSLHQLVRRRNGRNRDNFILLLMATKFLPIAELNAAVRLLLKAGADPNASDKNGCNAIHYLALKQFKNKEEEDNLNGLIRELIDCGAHPDQVRLVQYLGKVTPIDMWKRIRRNEGRKLPSWWRPVPSLACLSARSLSDSKQLYDETSLPVCLHSFVAMH